MCDSLQIFAKFVYFSKVDNKEKFGNFKNLGELKGRKPWNFHKRLLIQNNVHSRNQKSCSNTKINIFNGEAYN